MSRAVIRIGSRGEDVETWQAVLGVVADGVFGPKTQAATKAWQASHGLVADGVVGPACWALAFPAAAPSERGARMLDLNAIPMVKARSFRVANRPTSAVELIVIHSMESAEKPSTAENVAAWFASASNPGTSAHYCIDSDSIVQCVPLKDIAFAAPGSNHNGIQIELAGYARQTADEWDDEFSRAMVQRAGELVGALSVVYSIPLAYRDDKDLLAGARGVTTHYDVSKAFKKSTHRDPGPGFPMARLLEIASACR